MTLAKMSSEGDSAKNVSLDANEKVVNDLTDSSQDSADLKAENAAKEAKPSQNDVEKKEEKPEGTTEDESMDSENASVTSEKKEGAGDKPEDKPDSKDVKEEGETKENGTADTKKEGTDEKTEKKDKEEVKNSAKEEKDKEKVVGEGASKEQNGDEDAGEEEEDEEEEGDEEEEEEEDEELEEKKKPAAARGRKRKADTEPADKKEKKPAAGKDKEEDKEEEEEEEGEEEESEEEPEPTQVIFLDGGGLPLGEIARVEASVTRFKTDDLKNLHTLLFRMVGKMSMLKKNIKRFNGFTFKKGSEKYKKKVAFLNELELKDVKIICEQLDLQKMGSKEDLITRIMDFLMEPKEPGKNATSGGGEKGASGRPKRASAVRANNRGYSSHDDYSSDEKQRGPRSKAVSGKRPNLKDDSTSDEEFRPGGEDYDSEEKPKVVNRGGAGRKRGRPKKESSEEEASLTESEEDSDFDEEPKSKARKRTPAKVNNKSKKAPGRGRGRPGRGGAASKKKTPGRGRKPKDVTSESEEDDAEASSSEDEPLAKRSKGKKSGPPTDEDIKTFIKELLEGANLEEITMKTVCQKVYDNYPDFDLTNKKYFIKSTVKSLIST